MESEGFLHSRKGNYQWVSQAFADCQGIITFKSWDSRPQLQKQSQALPCFAEVVLPGWFRGFFPFEELHLCWFFIGAASSCPLPCRLPSFLTILFFKFYYLAATSPIIRLRFLNFIVSLARTQYVC